MKPCPLTSGDLGGEKLCYFILLSNSAGLVM